MISLRSVSELGFKSTARHLLRQRDHDRLSAASVFVVILSSITVISSGHQVLAEQQRVELSASLDLSGKVHDLRQNDRQITRAIVFLSTECPVSNSYTQKLNALHRSLRNSQAELLGVVSDGTVTRSAAANHFREFKAEFPVIFDSSGQLAETLKPTHVPEAFVISANNEIVYRGGIDDTWGSVGRRREKARKHYLRDAISAAIDGKAIRVSTTEPTGCLFEVFTPDEEGAVTFNRDIAPIIYSRCLNCHREGQVAPFELATYEQVAKRADWIAQVTAERIMPPWIPTAADHRFVGERWLSRSELSLLKQWSNSGRARGNPDDLPPFPEFAEGWRLGEPDVIVTMPEEFTVHADGPDVLQNFVIPIDIPSDRMVAAIEFHPGNKRVVHHAVLFLDGNGAARTLDDATPEPGYSNFGGPGFSPTGSLGGWSVGNTPRHLPNGMGRYLKKGSDLVMQIHYHPTGKEEVDQSEVGLYFIDEPVAKTLSRPAKLVGSIWMANYEMDIPAGESNYTRSTTYTLPKDVIMVGVVPHMHMLGKSMKVTATLPDAEKAINLIDVQKWNYNWQDEYYYERPFKLPAGTKLTVDAAFDNSEDNVLNPSSPPNRVTWGEGTEDEMLYCFFLISAEKAEDLIHVIFHNLGHDAKQPRADVTSTK